MENKIFKARASSIFKVKTKNYGTLQFENLTVWRENILEKRIKDLESIPPKELVLSIAAASLLKLKEQKYDYDDYKNNLEIFDDIKLELTESELLEFAEKYITLNSDLFEGNGIEIAFVNGPFITLPNEQELKEKVWSSNIFEKIKEAWIIYEAKRRKWLKNLIGITSIKNVANLKPLIENVSKINSIFSTKSFTDTLDTMPLSSNISNLLEIDEESTVSNEIKNVDILDAINNLLDLQKTIFEANQQISRITNENLEEQIKISRSSSKTSSYFSASAILISTLSLSLSLYFGYSCLSQKNPIDEFLKDEKNVLNKINLKLDYLQSIDEKINKNNFNINKNISK